MDNLKVYEKGSAINLNPETALNYHSIHKINVNKEGISKIVRVNNNLEVVLNNGEKVVIENSLYTTKIDNSLK